MKLGYRLREWQVEAIGSWRDQGRRGIVEVVTGGGKTVFAEACIQNALEAHPLLQIVIIVPTLALVDQWYVSLQEELGASAEDIAVFSAGHKPRPARFNLMVINTARTVAPELARGARSMLVVDECHRAGSKKNAAALTGDYAATLGLSATPERQYDEGLSELVVPALGPVIYRYGLVEARRDGVVTPFQLINVEVRLLPDEQRSYDQITRRLGRKLSGLKVTSAAELPEDVSQLLRRRARLSAQATMRVPVTVHLVDKHRGRRIMIFHEDIGRLTQIADALRARNHSVGTYHTHISPVIRRSNLRMYRQGMYDIIASCRALDEGINIPETEIAIVASATATTRQRIQRLGRVLRPSPGKDGALVYTLFATPAEHERLVVEAAELEGTAAVSWLRAGSKEDAPSHQ